MEGRGNPAIVSKTGVFGVLRGFPVCLCSVGDRIVGVKSPRRFRYADFPVSTGDEAFGMADMESWIASHDSLQTCGGDRLSGIDLELLRQNWSKNPQELQCNVLHEAWLVALTADQAGSNDGQ